MVTKQLLICFSSSVILIDNLSAVVFHHFIIAFFSGIVKELTQNGVVHDVRKLHVGDFGWIAQENTVANGNVSKTSVKL